MLLDTKIRQDETDVALGLLGLSPSPANGHPPEIDMASDSASRASSSNQWNGSQQSCSNKKSIDPKCFACRGRHVIHTCGTRALPIDLDEVAKQDRLRRDQEEEEKKKVRAEKRRLADQRRREARKHKQRELEKEQRRREEEEEIRLEKERLRHLTEEEEARTAFPFATVYPQQQLQKQHQQQQHPMKTPTAVHHDHVERQRANRELDVERQRREMIVASYANHLSHASVQAPVVEMDSVDYSRKTYEERNPATAAVAAASAVSTGPWERPRMAPFALANIDASPSPPPPPAEPPQTSFSSSGFSSGLSGSTSMGTLSSADALVALAGLAGLAGFADMKAEPQESVPGNGQSFHSAFIRPAATYPPTMSMAPTSHGFGGSLPAAPPRRAIPSFAVIRGQANGEDVGTTAPATTMPPAGYHHNSVLVSAPNGLSAGVAPEGNGGTSRSYATWPPHASSEGTAWPPTAS